MPDSRLGAGLGFDFLFGSSSGRQKGTTPLRLAILGDFSGQTNPENSSAGVISNRLRQFR